MLTLAEIVHVRLIHSLKLVVLANLVFNVMHLLLLFKFLVQLVPTARQYLCPMALHVQIARPATTVLLEALKALIQILTMTRILVLLAITALLVLPTIEIHHALLVNILKSPCCDLLTVVYHVPHKNTALPELRAIKLILKVIIRVMTVLPATIVSGEVLMKNLPILLPKMSILAIAKPVSNVQMEPRPLYHVTEVKCVTETSSAVTVLKYAPKDSFV